MTSDRANILIVDDDLANQRVATRILAGLDEHIVAASSAEETLRYLQAREWAVVLIDDQMRSADSLGLAEQIRRHESGREVPILIVASSIRRVMARPTSIDLGAIDYLEKPMSPAVLTARVRLCVAMWRRTTETAATKASLARARSDLERFAWLVSGTIKRPHEQVRRAFEHIEAELNGQTNQRLRTLLGNARTGTERMGRFVNGLSACARAEAQPLDKRLAPADHAVDVALAQLAHQLNQQGFRILRHELPEVEADIQMLATVFVHLIDNAIAYRDGRVPPEIDISAHGHGDEWVFRVRDNGRGMAPAEAKRVFDAFDRLGVDTSDHPGAGVGLTIARRLVERHGGRMWVDAHPGSPGTSFCFSLPREPDLATVDEPRTKTDQRAVMVDDDHELAQPSRPSSSTLR